MRGGHGEEPPVVGFAAVPIDIPDIIRGMTVDQIKEELRLAGRGDGVADETEIKKRLTQYIEQKELDRISKNSS